MFSVLGDPGRVLGVELCRAGYWSFAEWPGLMGTEVREGVELPINPENSDFLTVDLPD